MGEIKYTQEEFLAAVGVPATEDTKRILSLVVGMLSGMGDGDVLDMPLAVFSKISDDLVHIDPKKVEDLKKCLKERRIIKVV